MKNLTIAVWGERGCGVSSFSAALAQVLTDFFDNVLLASADAVCQGFALWGVDNVDKLSLVRVLTRPDISAEFVRKNIVAEPKHKCIGLLGYRAGENIELHNAITTKDAQPFFNVAKEIAPITIVDCGVPQYDAFAYEALNCADIVFTLFEPCTKGEAFYTSLSPVFSALEGRTNYFVCAKVRSDSPVVEVESKLGIQFDFKFPYSEEAIKKYYDCNLFDRYSGMTGRELKRMAEVIKEAATIEC